MTTSINHTSASTMNTVLSMSSSAPFDQKNNDTQNYVTYTATPRNWYRKPSVKFSVIDWDVNMNELEFE